MNCELNKIFEPAHIGPLTLRNRTIRSAAFESMCPGHEPSEMLYDYHTSVARGGVGMTTVAYAAVTESGLSFDRQLVMKKEIVSGLRRLTDGIHKEGAAAGIQLGHCGNMSHKAICGCIPVGACNGFNLYSPTIVRGLRRDDCQNWQKSLAKQSTWLARQALTRWKYIADTVILLTSSLILSLIIARMSTAARLRTGCAS